MTQLGNSQRRTHLARLRTGLGFATLGLLLLRQGLFEDSWLQLVAGMLSIGSSLAVTGGGGGHPSGMLFDRRLGGPGFLTANVIVICVLALAGALER